jgi:chromosome segregation ATPase
MTFQAIILILKNLPWKYILAGLVILAIGGTIFMLKSQRDLAYAQRDAANAGLEVAQMNYELCLANRENLQTALTETNKKIESIAAEKEALDRDLGVALQKARQLATAKRELAAVTDKYDRLRMQSENLTVCETYETALISLAGGTQ